MNEQQVDQLNARKFLIVPKGSIITIINALNGPSHYIRELQVTRGLPLGPENPIDNVQKCIVDQMKIFESLESDVKDHVLVLDSLYKDISKLKETELDSVKKAKYLSSVKMALSMLLNVK